MQNLVNIGEAARILGCHRDTVRRMVSAGKLRCYRTPRGHRRFDPADLAEPHRLAVYLFLTADLAALDTDTLAAQLTALAERQIRFYLSQLRPQTPASP